MKRLLIIVTLVALMGLTVRAVEIENSHYKVSVDPDTSTFAITAKESKLQFVPEGVFSQEVASAESVSVGDDTWGKGQGLEISFKNGDSGKFMLFDSLPLVLYRGRIVNSTDNLKLVETYWPFDMQIDLDTKGKNLKTISTAGLRDASASMIKGDLPVAGYMFMAVGDPETRKGAFCAWLTTDRGSGIAEMGYEDGSVFLKPRVEYGDLRIPAGGNEITETLVIGYDDDLRFGLEAYADAVAKHYNVKLPKQPGVYCTWYHANSSDEERLLKNAKFAREHLKPFGLDVMQIDDRWQVGGDVRKKKLDGKKHNGPSKIFTGVGPEGWYKSGMKYSADNLKAEGFTPGIWFIPFGGTYNDPFFADKQDMFVKYAKDSKPQWAGKPFDVWWGGTCIDMTHPKGVAYLKENVKRLAGKWGYQYFKMDGLFTGIGVRTKYPTSYYRPDNFAETERHNPLMTSIEAYRLGLKTVIETAGDDVFLLGCAATQNLRSLGASFGLVDAMRVGPDNGPQWDHWRGEGKLVGTMKAGPIFAGRVYFLDQRVWYNDPDPMYVRERVTLDQARALASWIALSGELNATSEDYYELPSERLDIIKRSLPAHGCKNVRPVDFLENEPAQIWLLSKQISGIDHNVVGLYNWDSTNTIAHDVTISCSLERMGLDSKAKYCGFDYWENEFVGPFKGKLSKELRPSSCRVISLRKVADHPQVVSTSRHITQGVVDLVSEKWDAKSKALTGVSRVVGKDPYEIRIVASKKASKIETTGAPEGTTADFKQDGDNIRVQILSPESTEVKWRIFF